MFLGNYCCGLQYLLQEFSLAQWVTCIVTAAPWVTAVTTVQSLAWKVPHATGMAKKNSIIVIIFTSDRILFFRIHQKLRADGTDHDER